MSPAPRAYYHSGGDLMWSAGGGTRLSRAMFEGLLRLSETEGDDALSGQLREALEAHAKWHRCTDAGVSFLTTAADDCVSVRNLGVAA